MTQTCRPAKCIEAMRVTLLDQCTLLPLCDGPYSYTIGCLIEPNWTPEVEEGEESIVKDNCGNICLRDDRCDLTKRWNLEVKIKEPDKEFLALIEGNPLVESGGNTIGVRQLAYGSCSPYVFVELWERTDDCDVDGDPIYLRHLFPAVRFKWTGNEREGVFRILQIEGKTNPVVTDAIGTGPHDDIPPGLIVGATPDEEVDYVWFEDDTPPEIVCGTTVVDCPNVGDGFFIDTTVVPGSDSALHDVVVDSLGRALAVGSVADGASLEATIYRFTPSGYLDTTFGGGDGKASIPVGASYDDAQAVAIDPTDGSYLVAYTEDVGGTPQPRLARFTSAGVLDGTWGVGGTLTIPGASASATTVHHALHIEASGDIVVGWNDNLGSAGHVSRLTPAGAAQDDVQFVNETVKGIARISDGLYATSVHSTGSGEVYAATSDLALGTHSDSAHILPVLTFQPNTFKQSIPVAVDASGNIYLAGSAIAGEQHIAVARFTAGLVLDVTWATDGIANVSIPAWDSSEALGIAIDAAGGVYAGGFRFAAGSSQWVVAKLDSTGTLVAAFDTDGITDASPSPAPAYAYDVALNTSGTKVYAVGLATPVAQGYPTIGRYNATTGAVDLTYGDP